MRVKIAVFERYNPGDEEGGKVGIHNWDISLPIRIENFSDRVRVAVENLGGGFRVGKVEGGSPELKECGRKYKDEESGDDEKGSGAFWETGLGKFWRHIHI